MQINFMQARFSSTDIYSQCTIFFSALYIISMHVLCFSVEVMRSMDGLFENSVVGIGIGAQSPIQCEDCLLIGH